MMKSWSSGSASEEAIHFNPAYCGALAYEFVRAYQNAKKAPVPFALVLLCTADSPAPRHTKSLADEHRDETIPLVGE